MTSALSHPEHVGGRRLWIDGVMRDLIDRLHYGDGTIGWEGDERLAVYFDESEQRWEIWRCEDDNNYRMVCRSAPGVPFDERLLTRLCEWDRNRRGISVHDQIVAANEAIDRARRQEAQDYISEEVAPRLKYAIDKE